MSLIHDIDCFVEYFDLPHAPLLHILYVNCTTAMYGLACDCIVLLHFALNLLNNVTNFVRSNCF